MIDIDRFNWFLSKLARQVRRDFGSQGAALVGSITYRVTIHTQKPLIMFKFEECEAQG